MKKHITKEQLLKLNYNQFYNLFRGLFDNDDECEYSFGNIKSHHKAYTNLIDIPKVIEIIKSKGYFYKMSGMEQNVKLTMRKVYDRNSEPFNGDEEIDCLWEAVKWILKEGK